MDVGRVRTQLAGRTELMLVKGGVDGEVHTGTRQVLYKEGQMPLWEFGIAVMLSGPMAERLADFDELMAGPHQVKAAIEEDRTLAGLVVDCDVTAVRGPTAGDRGTVITEWIVQIRVEEE